MKSRHLVHIFNFLFLVSLVHSYQIDAQVNQKKREWILGFSNYQYTILGDDDLLFLDYKTQTSSLFGLRFSFRNHPQKIIGSVVDFEFQFGNLDRGFYGQGSNPALGFQFFYGPEITLLYRKFSVRTLLGISYLWIGGAEGYRTSRRNTIHWVGTGGISDLQAAILNSMNNDPFYVPGYPSFSRFAPAINLALNLDFLNPFRLSFELIPLYDKEIRRDYRIGLLWIF